MSRNKLSVFVPMTIWALGLMGAGALCADTLRTPGGKAFAITAREIYVDHEKDHRSGHMGHALIDAGGGRILDFNSNVDGDRCTGHSGYGWMEYRISSDYGRTWGGKRVLPYSMKLFKEGKHTALCEKGVRAPDGRIILFFQITDTGPEICCEPWSAPTMCFSTDGGETFSEAVPTGAKPGRIYDAVVDDRFVYFLLQENEHFLGTRPEHVYKVYRSEAGGPFKGVTLPLNAKGKGYGAMEFAKDGSLIAYVYDSAQEDRLEYVISRDRGLTWSQPARARVAKRIRNPQVRRLGDAWFLVGRNGGAGDGLVFYSSDDGLNWDEGRMIDRRPPKGGTGYYSCLLPVLEPGKSPRMLLQYSHVYSQNRVNVAHRWISLADEPPLQAVAADPLVWLYADSRVRDVPALEELDVPSNGVADVNLLLDGLVPGVPVEVSLDGAEGGAWFRLGAVPVRRNTGITGFLEQGGRVNPYVTRRAPFDVFDVLKPLPARRIAAPRAIEALRLRLPCAALGLGERRLTLGVRQGGKALSRAVKLRVHAAALPDVGRASFKYTNWMSLGNMAERHGLELWSEPHWEMIGRYLRCLAAARQNMFLVPREALFARDGDGRLAFAKARFARLLGLCDRAGIWYLEGPHLASFTHGWGSPNFHPHFSTNLTTSAAGAAELRHLAGIVREAVETHGLQARWYQHVADEPSRHNAGEYVKTAEIVRSCLPGIRITDAVEQPGFESVVDAPCPKVDMYERRRADFATAREKPWCYTCCVPGGKWMNRLMDGELLKPTLLPWVCTISDVDGYLHWGGNHYQKGQDPFTEPYPSSWKGANGGNTLPPGDTHVVYPGADGPWPSVRLEATRAGMEDADLLLRLRAADPARADALVRRIARGFCDYSPDALLYRQLRRELLDALDGLRNARP